MNGLYRVFFGGYLGLQDQDVYASSNQDAINKAFLISAANLTGVQWTPEMIRASKRAAKVTRLTLNMCGTRV